MADEESRHEARLDRVESDVQTIRSEMGTMTSEIGAVKADVRGLSAILSRIEDGVMRAQERHEDREAAAKPNPVLLASVLITFMSIIVGGAWVIGGSIARDDERSTWITRELDRLENPAQQNDKHAGGQNGVENQAH